MWTIFKMKKSTDGIESLLSMYAHVKFLAPHSNECPRVAGQSFLCRISLFESAILPPSLCSRRNGGQFSFYDCRQWHVTIRRKMIWVISLLSALNRREGRGIARVGRKRLGLWHLVVVEDLRLAYDKSYKYLQPGVICCLEYV